MKKQSLKIYIEPMKIQNCNFAQNFNKISQKYGKLHLNMNEKIKFTDQIHFRKKLRFCKKKSNKTNFTYHNNEG